jgi:signal transduction histidine kinase
MGVRKISLTRLNWISITIRWAFVIIAAVWLYLSIDFNAASLWVLGLGLVTNIFAMSMAGVRYRIRPLHLGLALADVAFAYLLYAVTLQTPASMGWVGLLPLITAGLYFHWLGILLVILTNLLMQVGLAWWVGLLADQTLNLAASAILHVLVGAGVAFFSPVEGVAQGQPKAAPTPEQRPAKRPVDDRERQRTIYQLISALSSSLNYQRVLESAMDMGNHALSQLGAPAERLRSAVLLFVNDEPSPPLMQVAGARGLLPQDSKITLPGEQGVLAQALESGQTVLALDVHQDPELSRFVALHDCRSAYCIPLRAALETYGILLFAHPDRQFFSDDRAEILDIIGNQSMIALQNARLYQDLAQEKERMTEVLEESRKKLARDLHDGPTQSIAAIAMRVNFARRLMERDAQAAGEELYKVEEMARRTTKEIRHMLFTLRPLVLESQGLIAAWASMAEKTRETYNQEVIIQADQRVVDELEASKQSVVFYIAEEAVTNARKHAQAPHIWVRLKMLRDELSLLEIQDDGVGFNTSQVDETYENRGSLGMVNMRERAELVNGILRIDSAPGRGTRIQVIIPLSEDAADRLRRGM